MTLQCFLNLSASYVVVRLGRCAVFSFFVLGIVLFLRKTLLKKRIFLKYAIWSLFFPVLFVGKTRFFYETKPGVRLFLWWNNLCLNPDTAWLCWLYLGVCLVFGIRIFYRRRKVKRIVSQTEKTAIGGTEIYGSDMPVTPFSIGLFRAKIVFPKRILKEYGEKELRTILLHEKIHIRMGHLWFLWLWDILRVLLWPNLFLTYVCKYLKEDMEEACDRIAIQEGNVSAYEYGRIILKTLEVLQEDRQDMDFAAAFTLDTDYENMRHRITAVSEYRAYGKHAVRLLAALCVAWILIMTAGISVYSYPRYYPNENVGIFGLEDGELLLIDDSMVFVRHDKAHIYVDATALRQWMQDEGIQMQSLYISGGEFMKIPGMGAGGGYCYLYDDNFGDGIVQLKYESMENFWTFIFKIM